MKKNFRVRKDNTLAMSLFVLCLLLPPQLGLDLYMPSIPHMLAPLHTTARMVQFSLTAYIFPYALTPLLIGPLSDQYGRRPFVLLGLLVYGIAGILCGLSQSIGWLLWMRALAGIGGGMLGLFSRAIMRDVFGGDQLRRISSYQIIVWAFVPLIAPVIGGYLQHLLGWRANFYAMAVAGFVILALFYLFYPETKNPAERQRFHPIVLLRNYWQLLSHREVLAYIFIVFFLYGSYIAFILASPFLLQTELGLTAPQYGWVMFAISIGVMIGAFFSSRYASRLPVRVVLWTGLAIGMLASGAFLGIGLAGIFTVLAITIPAIFFYLSFGIVWPNAAAGAMQLYPKLSGSTAALIPFFASTGGCLMSFLIAHFHETSQVPLGWTLLVLMVLSGCALLLSSKRS